jgi:tRNA-dihydrouridine synthase A
VHRIKQDFPHLQIILNGGIKTIDQIKAQLICCDGVMMGREAYHNPYLLSEIDPLISDESIVIPSRHQIILALIPYIQEQLQKNVRLHSISRHILGLFHGQPGARAWRQHISENATKKEANESVILQALNFINC